MKIFLSLFALSLAINLHAAEPLKISQYAVAEGTQNIALPADASIISAGMFEGKLSVWAAYSPNYPGVKQGKIVVVKTGEEFPFQLPMMFVQTVIDGQNVYHVFSDK